MQLPFIMLFSFYLLSALSVGYSNADLSSENIIASAENNALGIEAIEVYEALCDATISQSAFQHAYLGYMKLKPQHKFSSEILSLVDFNKDSDEKRFYLIDLRSKKVLYKEYVTHGRNTGLLSADNFSNVMSSKKSSLGFYKTAETYHGKHGLSLRLDGLEKDINDRARDRAIVIHAADYACESFIKEHGRLGRSFGCPALPAENYKAILDIIKEGTLLYIHSSKSDYLKVSAVIN